MIIFLNFNQPIYVLYYLINIYHHHPCFHHLCSHLLCCHCYIRCLCYRHHHCHHHHCRRHHHHHHHHHYHHHHHHHQHHHHHHHHHHQTNIKPIPMRIIDHDMLLIWSWSMFSWQLVFPLGQFWDNNIQNLICNFHSYYCTFLKTDWWWFDLCGLCPRGNNMCVGGNNMCVGGNNISW